LEKKSQNNLEKKSQNNLEKKLQNNSEEKSQNNLEKKSQNNLEKKSQNNLEKKSPNNLPNNLSNTNRDEIYNFMVNLNKLNKNKNSNNYNKFIDSLFLKKIEFKDIFMIKHLINYAFSKKNYDLIHRIKDNLINSLKEEKEFREYVYLLLYLIKISYKINNIKDNINSNNIKKNLKNISISLK